MKRLEYYKKVINTFLEDFLSVHNPEAEKLYEPVAYALQGGKKIRPALVLLSTEVFGGNYAEAVMPALAIEIFHNFTLVHDDIMDKSPIRRGRPTVQKHWNPDQALLSGDAMLIMSYKFLLHLHKDKFFKVADLFTDTALKICEGQQLDMEFENQENIKLDDYLKMIRLKTAVLIATSFAIGAIIADAINTDTYRIYEYGLNLGLAFQIQDDYFDLYADENKFGKKIGNDIITKKKTFLYLAALENADDKTSENLKQIYESDNISNEEKISLVRKIYDSLNIKDIVEGEIMKYYKKAVDIVKLLQIGENSKAKLNEFADFIIKRDF